MAEAVLNEETQTSIDKLKRILLILAGGLIFIFGLLGIVDLTSDKLDQDITEKTTEETQVEDFNP